MFRAFVIGRGQPREEAGVVPQIVSVLFLLDDSERRGLIMVHMREGSWLPKSLLAFGVLFAAYWLLFMDAGRAEAACAHATTTTSCVEDDGTYYWIANDKIWLQVKKTSGFVVQAHNKATGVDHKSATGGTWPLGLMTGASDDRSTWKAADITNGTGSTVATGTPTTGTGNAQLQLAYAGTGFKYNDNTSTGIAVNVNFAIADGNEYVRVNASLDNAGGSAPIRAVYFADGGDLRAVKGGGLASSETLVVPKWVGGMQYADPSHNTQLYAEKLLGYPGPGADSLTMGWMDVSSANPDNAGGAPGGIGIAYVNKAKQTMEFRLKTSASGVSVKPVLLDPKSILDENAQQRAWASLGNPFFANIVPIPSISVPNGSGANHTYVTDDLLIAPHAGDWHAMADIYRKEYQRVMVDGSGNPDYLTWNGTPGVAGSAVSDKAKNVDVLKNLFVGLDNVLLNTFESIPETIRGVVDGLYGKPNADGSHLAAWLVGENEHGGYAGDVPVQVPALAEAGGTTGMTAANDAMAAFGVANYYYNHPFAWDTQNSEYTRSGSPIPAQNPNQHNEMWNGINHQTICTNNSAVQDFWHTAVIPNMKAAHAGNMQFDQASLVNVVCTPSGASDALSRLQSQVAGTDALAKMVRNELATGGGSFIESEGFNDLTARHIDMHSVQINADKNDWGGSWLPELERYAFPQYIVHDWPISKDLLRTVVLGNITEVPDNGTAEAREYIRLKTALRDAAAPGYPYGFRDRDGVTASDANLIAGVFRDGGSQQGTVVYYNASRTASVSGTITVDLAKLGIGSGIKTIAVSLAPMTGSFSVLDGFDRDPSGAGAPGWNAVNGTWTVATDGTQVYKQTSTTSGALFASTLGGSAASNGVYGDAEVYARVKASAADANGESGILLRYTNANNYVQLAIKPASSAAYLRFRIGGATSSNLSAALTVSSNGWYNAKTRVVGNALYAKVWADDGSAPEPGSWTLSMTFNNTAPLDTGKIALFAYGTTPSFDNVKVDALPPGTTLLADDFGSDAAGAIAPGWTNGLGTSAWQAAAVGSDNALRQTDTSSTNYHGIVTGSADWRDVIYSGRFKADAASGWTASFYARYGDNNNNVRLYVTPSAWALQATSGGVYTAGKGTSGTFDNAHWYRFKLKVVSGTAYGKVWQDGSGEPATWTSLAFNQTSPIASGKVALATNNTAASFDEIKVERADERKIPLNDDFDYGIVAGAAQGWNAASGTWSVVADATNAYQGSTATYAKSLTGDAGYSRTLIGAKVKFASNDAGRELSVFGRYSDSGDAYGTFVRLVCNASGCYLQSRANNVWGTPAALSVAPLNATDWYSVKLLIDNNVAVAKVWSSAGTEPNDWQGAMTFVNTGAIRHGKVGLSVANATNTGATIAARFDSLVVSDRVLANEFEDGTDSTAYSAFASPAGDAGAWVVKQSGGNKEYRQTNRPAAPNDVMTFAYNQTTKWADAVVSARMKYNNADTNPSMALVARYVDNNNFVRVVLLGNAWVIQARVGGAWLSGPYVAAPGGSFSPGTWYRVKMSVSQGSVQAKVWKEGDAEPPYQFLSGLSFNASTLGSGYIGFETANTDPSFDDLTVDGTPFQENALMQDNFDANTASAAAAGWSASGGTWQAVPDGVLAYQQTNAAAPFNVSTTGNPAWTDYTVYARMKSNSGAAGRDASVLARFADTGNFARVVCNAASCYLQTKTANNFNAPVQLTNGGAPIAATSQGLWYRVRLRVEGTTAYAKVWLEGTQEPAAWQANASLAGLAAGKAGFATESDNATFDDLSVTLK